MVSKAFPLPKHDDGERKLDVLEASWADFLHGLRTGMRFVRDGSAPGKMRLLSFAGVRQQFDVYRDRFKLGDEPAVVGALCYACEEGVPLPYWLAREVEQRIRRVYTEQVSLHTAFGMEALFPARGKKANNARAMLADQQRLWCLTTQLMHAERLALDPALKRILAEHRFRFRITTARRLFEKQDLVQRLHLGEHTQIAATQRLSKRRQTFRKP